MDEEQNFFRRMDALPADTSTLLVFADWLAERSDPREAGYRALARLGRAPMPIIGGGWAWVSSWSTFGREHEDAPAILHGHWYHLTGATGRMAGDGTFMHADLPSAAFDAAAEAFRHCFRPLAGLQGAPGASG